MTAQTGFDMPHRNPAVKRRKGCHLNGGSISLHKKHMRFLLQQERIQLFKQACRQAGKGLIGRHNIQMDIGFHIKIVKCLGEHFPVLACGTEQHLKRLWKFPQFMDNADHFDRFWPCTGNNNDFTHGSSFTALRIRQ